MTRDVITVDENDNLLNLLASLKTLRFRHLPVTDEDRLIGLVTDRDLLACSTSDLLPHRDSADRALLERFRVHDVMVRNVVTVSPEASLHAAGKLLLEQHFGCLPVVDDANTLVGIITSSDFVKLCVNLSREA